jgi:transcriptional regulator with XRE-family HTH domain
MDDLAVGSVVRSLRRRQGLRQSDVAALAQVSQPVVSRIERGRLEEVTLATLRRVGRVLELALPLDPRWRGGELPRLRDREHAAIVERCVRILRDLGWEVLVEFSFNSYGERGSVDIVAWHPAARALLLVEVKSRLLDLQALASG